MAGRIGRDHVLLYVAVLAVPLAWATGLSLVMWPAIACAMAVAVGSQRGTSIPAGFGLWTLFLIWSLASATRIDEVHRWLTFGYRTAHYVSAGLLLLYLCRRGSAGRPEQAVTGAFTILWLFLLAGGVAAIVAPGIEFNGVVTSLLPQSFALNDWVRDVVSPHTSSSVSFLGYEVPRPTAPFVYANEWASMLTLLLPFVLLRAKEAKGSVRRKVLVALILGSIAPLIYSLSRGAWISVLVGGGYFALRSFSRGKGFGVAVISIGAVTSVLLFGPLGDVVADRIDHGHSDDARRRLVVESVDEVRASPILGYGTPRPSSSDRGLPSVGTHGQIWLVLFSHGIPGAMLFGAWFMFGIWRSRSMRTGPEAAAHIVFLMAAVQMLFYEFVPFQIHVLMAALAIGVGHPERLTASRPWSRDVDARTGAIPPVDPERSRRPESLIGIA